MGSETFPATLAELEGMPKDAAVAVASDVLGTLPAGTSRKAAMLALKRRHDGKRATRLALAAQGGRSAG
jgi:hypothetical protein